MTTKYGDHHITSVEPEKLLVREIQIRVFVPGAYGDGEMQGVDDALDTMDFASLIQNRLHDSGYTVMVDVD